MIVGQATERDGDDGPKVSLATARVNVSSRHYSVVDGVNIALEMEQWAERAALARAARFPFPVRHPPYPHSTQELDPNRGVDMECNGPARAISAALA